MLILGVEDRDIGDPGVVCFESLERGKFGAIGGEYLISASGCATPTVVADAFFCKCPNKQIVKDVLVPTCGGIPSDAILYICYPPNADGIVWWYEIPLQSPGSYFYGALLVHFSTVEEVLEDRRTKEYLSFYGILQKKQLPTAIQHLFTDGEYLVFLRV